MPCRAPLEAVQHVDGGKPTIYKSGRRPKTLLEAYRFLELPCGQCVSCRLEKSRTWGIRCMLEAQYLWEEYSLPSTFITLTYDEKHLPMYGSLVPQHLQDFIKRLRSRIEPSKIKYYAAGEYGSTCPKHELKDCPLCGPIQRPHYHAIILGYGFPDRFYVGEREGIPVYESSLLTSLWKFGFHEIGSCSLESCCYVARYIMKKQTGPKVDEGHYFRYCPWTDAVNEVEPEFAHISSGHTCIEHRGMPYQQDCPKCSRGIGYDYALKYLSNIYPSDELAVPGRGIVGIPPKYFDEIYESLHPGELDALKSKRREEFAESLIKGPSLESRAIVQDSKIAMLARKE